VCFAVAALSSCYHDAAVVTREKYFYSDNRVEMTGGPTQIPPDT
jgi:hypothetical protein